MSSRALRKLRPDSESDKNAEPETDEICHTNTIFSQFASSFSPQEPYSQSSDESGSPVTKSKKTKKRKKKKNSKASQVIKTQTDSDYLIEVSSNHFENKSENRHTDLSELLKINIKMLDHVAELSRIFGSNVVCGAKASDSRRHSVMKRGLLVQIKNTWPPTVRLGLSMERLEDNFYTFVHSKEYQIAQQAFYAALESMDPNNLTGILYERPYHIDSLLQLSDIMMKQDNSTVGTDLLERTLHALQSAFHPSFNPLSASCYLDYKRQANRALFIALFRYILIIGERGCNRSALEYCKLLLSLDPVDDPLTVLLMIDQYAIFSKQYSFLLNLYDNLNNARNLYLLPNFAFSVPLAMKLSGQDSLMNIDETKKNCDLCLQDALIMFPGFLTRLLKHTTIGGITNLDKSALFGKEVLLSESESLGCLLNLYIARMHSIWTSTVVIPWLEKNVEIVLGLVESKKTEESNLFVQDPRLVEYSTRRKTLYPPFPPKILRHLILADVPEAPPVIPRNLQNTPIYSFDPLPPKNSINIYNLEEKQRNQSQTFDRGFISSLISSLFPFGVTQDDLHYDLHMEHNPSGSSNIGNLVQSATERLAASIRVVLERIDFYPSRTNTQTIQQDGHSNDENNSSEEDRF